MSIWRTIGVVAGLALVGSAGTLAVAALVGMDSTEIVHLAQALAPVAVATVLLAVAAARLLSRTSLTQRFLGVAVVAVVVTLANLVVLTSQMFVSDHDAALVSVLLVYALGAGIATAHATARASGKAIGRLDATARDLGQGRLDARVGDLGAGPELDTLGRTLDAMADRLEGARAGERRADAMRRDLIATMSHDLRTPLASLRAMVEAIDEGVVHDAGTIRRYAFEMRRSVDQLVDLVDDLFELTQLDVEVVASEGARSRLGDVVKRAIAAVGLQAAQKNLAVRAELGSAIDAPCSPRVARVMQNLLSNAVRHTPTDGTVLVTARQDASQVHIEVEDDGEGIAAEDLPHVFEPFYRADPARSGPGAGLGLALAERIVAALGGRIWVESRSERGSRFSLELPLR